MDHLWECSSAAVLPNQKAAVPYTKGLVTTISFKRFSLDGVFEVWPVGVALIRPEGERNKGDKHTVKRDEREEKKKGTQDKTSQRFHAGHITHCIYVCTVYHQLLWRFQTSCTYFSLFVFSTTKLHPLCKPRPPAASSSRRPVQGYFSRKNERARSRWLINLCWLIIICYVFVMYLYVIFRESTPVSTKKTVTICHVWRKSIYLEFIVVDFWTIFTSIWFGLFVA